MSKWSSAYRDSRWQRKRLEIMERDNFTCQSCGKGEADAITLNVHHIYYTVGVAPWEYPAEALITLCEKCHESVAASQKQAAAAIGGLSAWNARQLSALCNAFALVYLDSSEKMPDYASMKTIDLLSSLERFINLGAR